MAEQTMSTRADGVTAVNYEKPSRFRTVRFQDGVTQVAATIVATVGLAIVMFPILWMFSTSLKGEIEVFQFPPSWLPAQPQWNNYVDALTFNPFLQYFRNTFYFAGMVMIGEVIANSFIAFGFARLRAPGRNVLFVMVLATLMIPAEVTLIPQYILFSRLGWLNSFKPLIIPAWFGSPYLIFLLRQFYMGIPKEYDEAALIEGANYFTIWTRIILPLSGAALGVVAIMSFIFHWNVYQGPLIYLNDNSLFTVSLGLSMFRTPFGGTPWHWYMAASLTILIPPIVVFFVAQRYFIQGIVISGVKG